MANFDPIYNQILTHEGYYANREGDQGGMTYAGIARNIHPNWRGWPIVDGVLVFRAGVDLPNNHYINDQLLDQYVRDFYLEIWRKSWAGSIKNQNVAHLYFDFYVHSQKAVREVQQVLNALGINVAIDNIPGNQTISAMNSYADPARLHDAIKDQRIKYLYEVSKYKSNAQFLPGWLARLADFPNLMSTPQKAIVTGGIIVGILFTIYLIKT